MKYVYLVKDLGKNEEFAFSSQKKALDYMVGRSQGILFQVTSMDHHAYVQVENESMAWLTLESYRSVYGEAVLQMNTGKQLSIRALPVQ